MNDQIHLDVVESGSGMPMVFTHGWTDTKQAWEQTIAALGESAHCFAWDLRGHGGSEVPPAGQYTREDALADLHRVVAKAGESVVLVGHSLGGYLSLAYTLLHPEWVAGLVLVGAGPGFRNPETREQWNDNVDVSAAKFAVPKGSEMIAKHVDSWVIDNLGEITAPSLVIVGEHDKRFAASAAVFEKYLDVQASVVIPDAGHSVHRKHGNAIASEISKIWCQTCP
ncbi:MAG: alpha/beta hydrolase [Acidimicrobiales bacterium]